MKKSAKVVYITLAVLFALLLIGGLVLAFMLNYNLYCPEYVKIIDDGKNIYLTTSSNENYRLYRFIFTDESGKEIVIDSENNTLQSDKFFESGVERGKTYTVQSQYISENAEKSKKLFLKKNKFIYKKRQKKEKIRKELLRNLL